MEAMAIGLVLVSATLHAIRDFLTKKAGDRQIFVWLYEIWALIAFLPLFIFFVFKSGVPSIDAWLIGMATAVLHFFYWIFLSKSYDHGDLSHVYPIMRAAPAPVLLFAVIFLQEDVSIRGVVGILTVTAGIYFINLKRFDVKSLVEPFTSIFKERASQFALLTLLAVTSYSLVDKIGVDRSHPIIFVYFINFFAFIYFTPYILKTKSKSAILKEWENNKKSVVLNGIMVITGYSLVLIAYTLSKVSYVVGLRQISIVLAVLLGGHVLREKNKGIRFFAATLIFIGAFLIAVA